MIGCLKILKTYKISIINDKKAYFLFLLPHRLETNVLKLKIS